MPSKKKYNARFPPARIKKIMQTDEDVGKVAAAVPVLISKALEIFLESLIMKSSEQTLRRNAKTMSSAHIKQCIQTEVTFDFLKDLVDNVPDIGQGDNEDGENNHTSASATSNNRQQRGAGESFSRSNSTASSSSETPVKRKRGRPRKQKTEDVAGPSSRKHKITQQSSEDQTTSEDSDLSDMEIADETNSSSHTHLPQSTSISQSAAYQDTRQHQQSSSSIQSGQPPSSTSQPPSFGLPVMPQFQVPSAPSNPTSSSLGMGHFQMPKASHAGGDEDEDDDYDT